ncbi:unnamed protein product [Spirodela intermedia]|uniref:Retrovirus-related Pol polyprotein from transposon TNT 1-94-like beta-barrel domain-containing protein n=1 Tax=Spirodela intermedia TaxID=51605 RepID=A0A7I8K064_SPIIN|nr:unnamed protein product [Spirodela intermedia]
MPTKTNYDDWALLMKVKLRARLLWTAIEKGAVEPHEDMQALDALCSAVPPEMWPVIANKETAKEAWEAIATMRIGDDREGESVDDYALRLNSMASTLNTLGDKVEETQVVKKIIRSVPQRFRQIVVAITMLLDVSTLTVADLTEQAHVVQDEEEASLLLVKSTTAISTAPPPTSTPPRFAATPQAEDRLRRASPPPPGAKGVPVNGGAAKEERKPGAQTQIHLREEKVFAHLEEEELRDEEAWVMDTGATNHMSGSRTAFTELDTEVLGTVRFSDDSVALIEGRGAIVFLCKNGEHRSFARVYYIPRLTTNIVSVGQLDEAGYHIDIEKGAMKIYEPGERLLTKVMRGENRLYILHAKLIRQVVRNSPER